MNEYTYQLTICFLSRGIAQKVFPMLKNCFHIYTRSLVPADFSGAVFTHAHFQKIAQICSLCYFHYIGEGIALFIHFWLLITSVLRIWFMRTFPRPKKMQEPRTHRLGEIDEEITKVGF